MNFTGTVQIFSKGYLAGEDETWNAVPSSGLLQRLHEETARWIAVIDTPDGMTHRIALGDPVREAGVSNLYLPQWFCHQANLIGDGEDRRVSIHFERCESLTKATQIVFVPIGHVPEDLNIGELLEEPLSQLGVIQEGMTIPVPCFEGNLYLQVKSCEPSYCVFLDGKEISYSIEDNEHKSRTPTPMPTPLTTPIFSSSSQPSPDFFSSMVPMVPLLPLSGGNISQTGTATRRNIVQRTSTSTLSFSFEGVGRRLNEI